MIDYLRKFLGVAPSKVHAMGGTVERGPDISGTGELAAFLRSDQASVGPRAAMTNAALFRCITLISGAIATTPFRVEATDDGVTYRPATDHPARRLLQIAPNRWQSASQFRRMCQAHLLLRGNAYSEIVRVQGRIVELRPFMPDHVEVRQAIDGLLVYRVAESGGVREIRAADMLHLRGISLDGIIGLSPLEYARSTVGIGLASARHAEALNRNAHKINAVLEADETLSQAGIENVRASLEEYRGADNAGKMLILDSGLKYRAIGISQADAQFIETQGLTRLEIAMFYGVPPSMIGDNTGADSNWGTGLEEKSRGFATYTLNDWFVEWQDTAHRALCEGRPELRVRASVEELTRADTKSQTERTVRLVQFGIMSPDEARAEMGRPPRQDGDGGRFYPPPNQAGTESNKRQES